MTPLAQTDHRRYTCEKYSLRLLKHRFGIMPRVALSEAWATRRKLRAGFLLVEHIEHTARREARAGFESLQIWLGMVND